MQFGAVASRLPPVRPSCGRGQAGRQAGIEAEAGGRGNGGMDLRLGFVLALNVTESNFDSNLCYVKNCEPNILLPSLVRVAFSHVAKLAYQPSSLPVSLRLLVATTRTCPLTTTPCSNARHAASHDLAHNCAAITEACVPGVL